MAKPRRHHFVQAAHIKQFADANGRIWVYGKDGATFQTSAEGIFAKRDLNSYDTPEGIDATAETFITQFENDSFPALLRTISSEEIRDDDLVHLTAYLAVSRIRNPGFQAGVIESHRATVETTAKMMDQHGKFDELGPPPFGGGRSLSELLTDGTIQIDINNSVYLRLIFDLAERAQILLLNGFRWSLVKSPRGRVLISDHPFTFVHPGKDFGAYGSPMGGSGCEVAFPLSKNLYLLGAWEKQLSDSSSEDDVDELNKRQAIFANRHIASAYPSRRWRELSMRYRRWGFQTRVDVIGGPTDSCQIVRSKVFPIRGTQTKPGKNPVLQTRPIATRKRSVGSA